MGAGNAEPGVSIVVPHYGDPSLTRPLIDALLRQRNLRPIQIIVADDHSPEPFPDIDIDDCMVVRREVNGGFGSAVNTGASHAVHPLLLILNSDLTIGESFIEDLCTGSEPWMPAIVSPTVVDEHGHSQFVGRRFPTISASAVASLVPLARWRNGEWWHRAVGHEIADGTSSAMVCDWVVGAVMLIPTNAFHRLGGFDERFFMNSEEVDLQRRAREIQLPSVVLRGTTVEHVGGGSSDQAKRFQWLMQGEWRYQSKWNRRVHARMFQVAMLSTAIINLVWDTGRALLGRPTHPMRAFRHSASAIIGASRD